MLMYSKHGSWVYQQTFLQDAGDLGLLPYLLIGNMLWLMNPLNNFNCSAVKAIKFISASFSGQVSDSYKMTASTEVL